MPAICNVSLVVSKLLSFLANVQTVTSLMLKQMALIRTSVVQDAEALILC